MNTEATTLTADNEPNPNQPYSDKHYFLFALDPIHIGTGGFRLGEVDMTIVRDPATNIPKLPGSSLAGVCRTYTAMKHGKYLIKKDNKIKSCAGKGGDKGSEHCGVFNCKVCIPYGFSDGNTNLSFQGLAAFSDAQILFFPIRSSFGPVWITSPLALSTIGINNLNISKESVRFLSDSNLGHKSNIALGWLVLEPEGNEDKEFRIDWGIINECYRLGTNTIKTIQEISRRGIVLVSDAMFTRLVNSNLEVRTSVAIDPRTGAAEDGALYTYEAIPRGTIFKNEIIYSDPNNFRINDKKIGLNLTDIKNAVEDGLAYFPVAGIGGMGNRGMGRLRVLNLKGDD